MLLVLSLLLAWFAVCLFLLIRSGFSSSRQTWQPFGKAEHLGDMRPGDLSGAREPRRPKPSRWPPRRAAAVPENDAPSHISSAFGSSESTGQPLRLEDGLA